MAMGGVGEAMLLSAAVGGGSAALTGGDPLKGALLGGLTGGLGAGISGALGSTGTTVGVNAGSTGINAANSAANSAATISQAGQGFDAMAKTANVANTAGGAANAGANAGNVIANMSTPTGAAPFGFTSPTGAAPLSSSGVSPVVSTQPFGADVAFNKTFIPSGSGAPTVNVIPNNVVSTGGIDRLPAATKSTFTEGMQKFINDPMASIKANPWTAASAALSGATGARKDFEEEEYNGPLKRFKYNPDFYVPAFADGGITNLAANSYDLQVGEDPYPTNMASGGISNLGGYSDYARGGRMLKGPGDGMSDSIPASISGKRPARLADGEFVVPADVVSHLGNGSTDAGAKQLYAMMNKVRQARTGRKAQGREINPRQYMPAYA
jgi:hypothetical protein